MNPQSEYLDPELPRHPRPRAWYPVRRLHERHRARVLDHLLALDDSSRHLRFGHVAGDEQLRQYVAQLDFVRDELFGTFNSRLQLVAMAHLAFSEDGTAEFGVSVSERQRGRGLGGRLFEHAVMHARNRGVSALAIHLARDNAPMLAIVRRSGATVEYEGADAIAHLTLPSDTLGSQLTELLETQAAELDYRWKMQVLRLDRLLPRSLQVPRT